MKRLIYIFLVFFATMASAQNSKLFEQGKEFYKNGKYQQAIDAWKQILDNGEVSSELYFNIGNAQYKLNQIGPSIYYYEKALQLSPNDSDIKNNLAFAENARIDAIEPLPKSVFSKWYNALANIFTYDGWAILAVVGSVAFVICFLIYYFSYSERQKRIFFAASTLAVLVLIGSTTMAFITYGDYRNSKPAIVFADQIEVKNEPSMGSNPAFILHEGTKVQILAKDGNWYRIQIADGKDGWVAASEIKKL